MARREERRLVTCLFIDVVAVREELAHDAGGPEPRHAALREIGYVGLSELLRRRVSVES